MLSPHLKHLLFTFLLQACEECCSRANIFSLIELLQLWCRAKYGIEEMCSDQWKWASKNPYGYQGQETEIIKTQESQNGHLNHDPSLRKPMPTWVTSYLLFCASPSIQIPLSILPCPRRLAYSNFVTSCCDVYFYNQPSWLLWTYFLSGGHLPVMRVENAISKWCFCNRFMGRGDKSEQIVP